MNNCPTCSGLLKLLQYSIHDSGLPIPSLGSERTAEIRGCRKCDATYYFGATRTNQQEHWMKTPFKFNEFDRANEDWDQAWNNIDKT
jgi:hypothetical protein